MQDFQDSAWLRFERGCLKRALRGDREAFGQLYDAFSGPLYRHVLLPRLGNEAAAEDALAETFCAALQGLEGFQDRQRSIWFWLARIAANKAVDMHRRQVTACRALVNLEGLLDVPEGPQEPGDGLMGRQEAESLSQRVAQTMGILHDRYREALDLRFIQSLSREECAERMAVKVGTFDVVLLRALRAFRKEWDTRGAKEE